MTKDEMVEQLAIRKITPTEAFRLMGMKDEDCEKCQTVGLSNSALYKICGNGLLPQCVSLILEHLYKAVVDNTYICTDERMIADGFGI